MEYILLFFILLFILDFMGGSKIVKPYFEWKNTWVVIFIGLLILIGLRDRSVGTDTLVYTYDYLAERTFSFDVFFTEGEPLFYLFSLLCKTLSDNYTIYLTLAALPISLFFALFTKKNSTDQFLSVLIFSVLGIMSFCMAGIRQTLGMAFCIPALKYARERKLLPFLLFVAIGYGFHNSAIVFLIVYPIVNLPVSGAYWVPVGISYILGITKNPIVMQIANTLLSEDRYGAYLTGEYKSELTMTMFFIQLSFFALCFFFKARVLEEDPGYAIFYNMAFIGLMLQCFTPILGEFFRISMYFSFSLCVLVPRTIMIIKNEKVKKIAYLGVAGAGMAYTFLMPTSYVYTYMFFR